MTEVPPKDYHRPIPHHLTSDEPIVSSAEKDIKPFEKHIHALHSMIIAKGKLPSFDPIRRAAEEVDGIFDSQKFSPEIPDFLKHRWPEYSERRIFAVETVLCELGLVSRDELKDGTVVTDSDTSLQASSYPFDVDQQTYSEPRYHAGDSVQVSATLKPGHIRTPLYLLGKQGKIVNFQGMFLSPEDLAHFKPTVFELPLYLVECNYPARIIKAQDFPLSDYVNLRS
ncbi:MAG: SH3-like domain-containing protein [Cyanobacteria bacterium P01_A01_bin.37]